MEIPRVVNSAERREPPDSHRTGERTRERMFRRIHAASRRSRAPNDIVKGKTCLFFPFLKTAINMQMSVFNARSRMLIQSFARKTALASRLIMWWRNFDIAIELGLFALYCSDWVNDFHPALYDHGQDRYRIGIRSVSRNF